MATAKQIAWRKKFAARYGKKKARSKTKTSPRTSKGRTLMARRRRTFRSAPRRFARAARGRVRQGRSTVIPWADVLHGVYTLDGATDGRIGAAAVNVVGSITNQQGMTFDNGIAHVAKGIDYATKNPGKAVQGGAINFAKLYLVRKALGWVGVPKTVKVTKKIRIQTGAL